MKKTNRKSGRTYKEDRIEMATLKRSKRKDLSTNGFDLNKSKNETANIENTLTHVHLVLVAVIASLDYVSIIILYFENRKSQKILNKEFELIALRMKL